MQILNASCISQIVYSNRNHDCLLKLDRLNLKYTSDDLLNEKINILDKKAINVENVLKYMIHNRQKFNNNNIGQITEKYVAYKLFPNKIYKVRKYRKIILIDDTEILITGIADLVYSDLIVEVKYRSTIPTDEDMNEFKSQLNLYLYMADIKKGKLVICNNKLDLCIIDIELDIDKALVDIYNCLYIWNSSL